MTTWVPRTDGGRPEGRYCVHGDQYDPPPAAADGCHECVAAGKRWVHLLRCLTCGHLGCCDSSPGAHASSHYEESGHPVAKSAEPGEEWAWCYADEVYLRQQ
ncbi:UBP-type zinc finger domain-containing protein [Streptomyces recifensis]|uniref:UBP-type zinc finger domain-containing protein n=1 Tax=Streptomyces recifensis TaxID=67355 RepID=UPI000A3CD118|nr:UBP-type zinc finger domain-containing protein [Streptomyces recifensis]